MSRMKRDIAELAGWLFRDQAFPHGVILLTGTSMVPPEDFTLHAGDTVTIASDRIGRLVNRVGS
jgi:2-dehydro-3-deoxy-D-arabinonate dehydratase